MSSCTEKPQPEFFTEELTTTIRVGESSIAIESDADDRRALLTLRRYCRREDRSRVVEVLMLREPELETLIDKAMRVLSDLRIARLNQAASE